MNSLYHVMMRKLIRFYAGCAILLAIIMNGYNVFIDGSTWSHIFQYDFYFVLVGNAVIFLMLLGFTFLRLRKVQRFFSGDDADHEVDAETALRELLRFPVELGVFFLACSVIFSFAYHFVEMMLLEIRPLNMVVVRHVLVELAAGLSLSMLFSGLARIYVTPCAAHIAKKDMRGIGRTTFLWSWVGTFFSLFLVTGIILILSVINWEDMGGASISLVVAVSVLTFLFGIGVFWMLMSGFLGEIRTLIQGMYELHLETGEKKRNIPVTSRDETGQLAEAINALQGQIEREYEGIRKELELAYEVQQRLLPPPQHEIGSFQIACHSRPALEVGGDLYDVLRLSEQQFVLLIGDVSGKGMPAALVMSAVITLFRTEARLGGTAGEIMTRLNRQLSEALRGTMMVTLGIGQFDCRTGTLTYASAGHLAPYVLSKDGMKALLFSSLPLGFAVDEVYQEQKFVLHEDDCLVFLTDGVIERMDDTGEMFGFEWLEQVLAEVHLSSTPAEKLAVVTRRLFGDERTGKSEQSAYADDWTLVFVQRTGKGVSDHAY